MLFLQCKWLKLIILGITTTTVTNEIHNFENFNINKHDSIQATTNNSESLNYRSLTNNKNSTDEFLHVDSNALLSPSSINAAPFSSHSNASSSSTQRSNISSALVDSLIHGATKQEPSTDLATVLDEIVWNNQQQKHSKNHPNIGHIIDGADAYPVQATVIPSPIARPVPKNIPQQIQQTSSKTFTSSENKKLTEFGEKYDFTFNPSLAEDSQSACETPANCSNSDSPVPTRVFNENGHRQRLGSCVFNNSTKTTSQTNVPQEENLAHAQLLKRIDNIKDFWTASNLEEDSDCVKVENETSLTLTNTSQQQLPMGNVAKVRPQPQLISRPITEESQTNHSLSFNGNNNINSINKNSTNFLSSCKQNSNNGIISNFMDISTGICGMYGANGFYNGGMNNGGIYSQNNNTTPQSPIASNAFG